MRAPAPGLAPALAAMTLLACAGGPGGTGADADAWPDLPDVPAADVPTDDAPLPGDTPIPDDALEPDATPDVPDWTLPPCYRACDRVTACGVESCLGFDWASAGSVFESCFTVCDDAWAAAVLDAPGCPQALAVSVVDLPDVSARCDTNPCDAACESFATCLVDQCPSIEDFQAPGLRTACHDWCSSSAADWLLQTPCVEVVAALSEDPSFAEGCSGPAQACPGPDVCDPWGVKVTGCVVAHCAGNADAYAPGLETLVSWVCQHDTECGSPEAVQALLSADVTCESPALATAGLEPPFAALCAGTLGVASADIQAACTLLAACPGAEWLEGVPGCMAFVAILADAAQRTQCLRAAADCAAAYACLEGA